MPEGPELNLACKFINKVCENRVFGGKVIKSDVSKSPEITWQCETYRISSISRGKEIMLTLKETLCNDSKVESSRTINILFHFGMSGVFKLSRINDIPKHSHLRFFTVHEEPEQVLSFVDVRRFGSWQQTSEWSKDRGPDPVYQYEDFRTNVLGRLDESVFKKSICEVLLNQNYFNGIGNYLRAEILFRAGVQPFEEARSVLKDLCAKTEQNIKIESKDLLQLCHDVPLEVINLDVASSYDPSATREDLMPFLNWLQVYDKPGMKKLRDHNKRTIWFSGDPGPLAPKSSGNILKKAKKKKNSSKLEEETDDDSSTTNGKLLKKEELEVEEKAMIKLEKKSIYFSPRVTRSKTKQK